MAASLSVRQASKVTAQPIPHGFFHSLEKTRSCEDAAGVLFDRHALSDGANSAVAPQAERAETLHCAVMEELSAQTRYERYGLRMGIQLRNVAVDWLDVLLRRNPPLDPRTPLIRLAEMLDVSLDPDDYLVRPRAGRVRLITYVKRLSARRTALVIAEALLSRRVGSSSTSLISLEGLRDYWLWLVIPVKAIEELINRSTGWPV